MNVNVSIQKLFNSLESVSSGKYNKGEVAVKRDEKGAIIGFKSVNGSMNHKNTTRMTADENREVRALAYTAIVNSLTGESDKKFGAYERVAQQASRLLFGSDRFKRGIDEAVYKTPLSRDELHYILSSLSSLSVVAETEDVLRKQEQAVIDIRRGKKGDKKENGDLYGQEHFVGLERKWHWFCTQEQTRASVLEITPNQRRDEEQLPRNGNPEPVCTEAPRVSPEKDWDNFNSLVDSLDPEGEGYDVERILGWLKELTGDRSKIGSFRDSVFRSDPKPKNIKELFCNFMALYATDLGEGKYELDSGDLAVQTLHSALEKALKKKNLDAESVNQERLDAETRAEFTEGLNEMSLNAFTYRFFSMRLGEDVYEPVADWLNKHIGDENVIGEFKDLVEIINAKNEERAKRTLEQQRIWDEIRAKFNNISEKQKTVLKKLVTLIDKVPEKEV